MDLPNETVSVLTPTTNELVKLGIDVLKPEIKTASSLLSSRVGR